MNQDCLARVRELYSLYTGTDIADCIRLIRSEMTAEEMRTELQNEILKKHAELESLKIRA
jgi:hypothetical protein